MVEEQGPEIRQRPVWREAERQPEYEPCKQGDHSWIAYFLESGRLAYWQCEICGEADRRPKQSSERPERTSGWIESPLRLTARGAHPPTSTRKWTTNRATTLIEGDPSSILFVSLPIPELEEAHTYIERDEHGNIRETYEPSSERHSLYGDSYTLTRYQVVGTELVQFRSYCFEESTYDIPNAKKPDRKVVLSGLRQILPTEATIQQ